MSFLFTNVKKLKAPLLNKDKDDVEESKDEDDRAADDVEPGVHRLQHLLEGWAGEKTKESYRVG